MLKYELIGGPSHGWIDVLDTEHLVVSQNNASSFTSTELLLQQVKYSHDGSESKTDSFKFLVTSLHNEDFLVSIKGIY